MVAAGVKAYKESGSDFVPTMPKFLAMCREAGLDWQGAYNRLINHQKPLDRIEELTRQDCGFAIRNHLDADKAEALFKKTYFKWIERERKGEIPDPDVKMLAAESTVSCTDKAREEFARNGESQRAQQWVERLKKAKDRRND